MAVTAKFVPEQIELLPNTPSTLTLRLYNDDAVARTVTLTASGDLHEHLNVLEVRNGLAVYMEVFAHHQLRKAQIELDRRWLIALLWA